MAKKNTWKKSEGFAQTVVAMNRLLPTWYHCIQRFKILRKEKIRRDCHLFDIITAKYYDLEHPCEILLDIDPIEFEWLIEALYKQLGYKTEMSPKTNDQGIDILASKNTMANAKKY